MSSCEFEWKNSKGLISMVFRLSEEEAETLLSEFDEASATSPSAANSRELARLLLIELKRALSQVIE